MFVSDILWSTRNDYLNDIKLPYRWKDEELLRHLNKAYPELCRETGVLRDASTTAITQIPIVQGQPTYKMDPRITEIHSPVYGISYDSVSQTYTEKLIDVRDDFWADQNIPFWRTTTGDIVALLPDYDAGSFRIIRYPPIDLTKGYWTGAFVFISGANSIAHAGGLFSTYLSAGDNVIVSGSLLNGTTAIPKEFTVVTPLTDYFVVSEALVDETVLTGGIVQKVIMTLNMTVNRLPISTFTIGAILTQSPEIKSDFHPYLIDGILRDAYLKQDTECLDKEKAAFHKGQFEENKQKIRLAMAWMRNSDQRVKPHFGAL